MFATVSVPRSFSFCATGKIVFQTGASKQVADEVRALGGTRALVVSEKGVVAAGITDPIIKILAGAGLNPTLFKDISPNPRDTEVSRGVEIAREHRSDVFVAVGGGSTMDCAKAIGTILANGGHPRDYAGYDLMRHCPPPIVAIPTTSGTASEVTAWSIITDTENRCKVDLGSQFIFPKVALLDPAVTTSLPPAITASTGMDAFCHAFEAYTCLLANPITDSLALYAMEMIVRYLPMAVADGSNIDARGKMQLASTIAGLAFGQSDVCGAHAMAEAIGGMMDIPHGAACAIFLPHVFEFNMETDYSKHARVAEVIGVDVSGLSHEEAAGRGLEAVRKLIKRIGVPRLRDFPSVIPEELPQVAALAANNMSAPSQPRPTTDKDYLELLQAAWRA